MGKWKNIGALISEIIELILMQANSIAEGE
jgi:hypothetical protein